MRPARLEIRSVFSDQKRHGSPLFLKFLVGQKLKLKIENTLYAAKISHPANFSAQVIETFFQ